MKTLSKLQKLDRERFLDNLAATIRRKKVHEFRLRPNGSIQMPDLMADQRFGGIVFKVEQTTGKIRAAVRQS